MLKDYIFKSDEEKNRLREVYFTCKRAKKEYKKEVSVGSVGLAAKEKNTSLFSAEFCSVAVQISVLSDQGTDVNLVPPSILKLIQGADLKFQVSKLPKLVEFPSAKSKAEKGPCNSQICADVWLRLRHGTNFMLRQMTWYVSGNEIQHVYIGRYILTSLGLNNRMLREVSAHKFSGAINVTEGFKRMEKRTQRALTLPHS